MVNHIIVTRPGYDIGVDHVGPDEQSRIVDLRKQQSDVDHLTQETAIYITDAAMKDIAATDIRRAAQEGKFEQLAQYVPEAVAEYIVKYRLYQGSNERTYS